MYETILVGVDGSDPARAALEHAIGVGRRVGATVHVLTVVEPRASPMTFGVEQVDEINRAAEALVEDLVAEYDGDGVDLVGELRRGRVHEELLVYADQIDADLIVVGQRGGDRLERALLGSIPDRLARLTEIPLTIVPPGGTGRGGQDP